nr:putative reverse transcriptase domain-containing protein [Tanacetum cinerariifolium]
KTKEEHEELLRIVLETLRQEKLYAKFSRCEFWLGQVAFLGHIVSVDGITMDPAKAEAITKWPISKTVNKVRSFLGLGGYYKRSVEGFSRLALPLIKLMRKGEKFVWNEEREKSFKELKKRLVSAPILTLPSGFGGFQIYSDASKKGLGYVLMQHGKKSEEDEQTKFRVDDDGVMWFGDRLCVPIDPLFKRLCCQKLTVLLSFHPGSTKMYGDLKQHFWWNCMKQDIATYVGRYLICQQDFSISRLKDIFQQEIVRLHGTPTTTKCRAPIYWNEVGERVIEGPELIEVTNEKVAVAKEKLKEARSRQKSYTDRLGGIAFEGLQISPTSCGVLPVRPNSRRFVSGRRA